MCCKIPGSFFEYGHGKKPKHFSRVVCTKRILLSTSAELEESPRTGSVVVVIANL